MSKKNYDVVPWSEIEPLLEQLRGQNMTMSQAFIGIGYSGVPDRDPNGNIKRSIKYALMGLVAEKLGRYEVRRGMGLSPSKLERLIKALITAKEALPGLKIDDLLGDVALELATALSPK